MPIYHFQKFRKLCVSLKIGNLGRLQLQLELVCNQRNKFRISRFSLGIADSIPKESLQCIQVASVPGHFDGMADGTLHSGRGGLECFCQLRVQYLGDGVSLPDGKQGDIFCVY